MWFLVETVRQAWRVPSPTQRALLALLGGMLVSAAFNFSAHLWVTGSLGLVAVCGLRVLAQET